MDQGESYNNNNNGNDNLLRVETLLRPRANSDPGVFTLPEIIVQDCSGECVSRRFSVNEDDDFFSLSQPIRPRSNTCPEDLFRKIPERPDTPPPISGSVSRGRFNFISPSKTCVSFVHHNLSKIIEDDASCAGSKQPKRGMYRQKQRNDTFTQNLNKDFQLKLSLRDKNEPAEASTRANGSVGSREDKCVFTETVKPAVSLR